MNRSRLGSRAAAVLALGAAALVSRPASADDPAPAEVSRPAAPRPIDLVLCLDTSGSMEGLINSARQKLWGVVNELASAKPAPALRVALLTYGGPGHDETGHVILQTPLTSDLDVVSERLFALGTDGGDEYVGRVVRHALDHLAWSGGDALRVVFVAGNEGADQDQVAPFREVVAKAVARGIVVNSIYCGNPDDGEAPAWREVATIGHGRFASIDQDRGVVALATPFDKDLEALSGKINGTYLAFGRLAGEGKARQEQQDKNAAGASPAAPAERALSKASGLYDNGSWDILDASQKEGFDLAKVPVEDLPEEMRKMTPEQRKAHVEAKRVERTELQAKIKDLASKREAFVAEEMRKKGLDDAAALDRAIRDAVREEAAAKGFQFGK
jgi:hypothetical protein